MTKAVIVLVLFLLLGSLLVTAETGDNGYCSGFWSSLRCFFWGNPENRAGQAWFDRGNVVGQSVCDRPYSGCSTIRPSELQLGDRILIDGSTYQVISVPVSYAITTYDLRQVNPDGTFGASIQRDVNTFPSQLQKLPTTPVPSPASSIPEYARTLLPSSGTPEAPTQPQGGIISDQPIDEYIVNCDGTHCTYERDNLDIDWNELPEGVQDQVASLVAVAGYIPESGTLGSAPAPSSVQPPPSGTAPATTQPAAPSGTAPPAASPSTAPPSSTPPLSPEVPLYLADQLPDGTVIRSTSGAEFEIKNGQFTQTKRARGSTETLGNLQMEQSELAALNNAQLYEGRNKKFTLIPPTAIQEQAKRDLGPTVYERVKNNIDWYQALKAGIEKKNYIVPNVDLQVLDLENGLTSVSMEVRDASGNVDKEKTQTFTVMNGQEVFIQTEAQKEKGFITLADTKEKVYIGKDKDIKNIGDIQEITYYENEQAFKDKDPLGKQSIKEGVITNTDFKKGTQLIRNSRTGETQDLTGTWYEGRKKDDGFVARGGEYVYVDEKGEEHRFGIDYDYEGFGEDQTLAGRELYDKNGRFTGIMQDDGTVVLTQRRADGTEEYVVRRTDGHRTLLDAQGTILRDSLIDSTEKQLVTARAELQAAVQADITAGNTNAVVNNQEARQRLDTVRDKVEKLEQDLRDAEGKSNKASLENTAAVSELQNSLAGWQRAQTVVESIYAVTRSVRDYPALSRLFGLPTGDDFIFNADKTFAPLLGRNWFPSAICEGSYDLEPEGFAVIKTVSGTYQAVAGIQMERSASPSPILCQRAPQQEAEEQFICDRGYACVDDAFCYRDADEDGEADSDEPATGYFYKITWGVTAPRDEAFTPLLDEDGVAVSFNVWLDNNPDGNPPADFSQGIYLYSRQGDYTTPIRLRNGDKDQDVIIHYSPNLYEEACIKWSQAPSTIMGEVTGDRQVDDVCFTVDVSSVGEVNWQRSGQPAPSVTVHSGEVQRNSGW